MGKMEVKYSIPKEVKNDCEEYRFQARKALGNALKIKGYRLRDLLKEELKKGNIVGLSYPPLREISKRNKGSWKKEAAPLAPMHKSVMYTTKDSSKGFTVAVGWTGDKVSNTWKRIAKKQQEGFKFPVTDHLREFFAKLGERVQEPDKKDYFYFNDEKEHFKTPARPIIKPFWDRHREQTKEDIRIFFKAKMEGKTVK